MCPPGVLYESVDAKLQKKKQTTSPNKKKPCFGNCPPPSPGLYSGNKLVIRGEFPALIAAPSSPPTPCPPCCSPQGLVPILGRAQGKGGGPNPPAPAPAPQHGHKRPGLRGKGAIEKRKSFIKARHSDRKEKSSREKRKIKSNPLSSEFASYNGHVSHRTTHGIHTEIQRLRTAGQASPRPARPRRVLAFVFPLLKF